jgi:hypothetical protein
VRRSAPTYNRNCFIKQRHPFLFGTKQKQVLKTYDAAVKPERIDYTLAATNEKEAEGCNPGVWLGIGDGW